MSQMAREDRLDHLNPRRSASETVKFCTGCDKTTRHDIMGDGTLTCRACGHLLGRKTAKQSDVEEDPGQAAYRLHTWPYNGLTSYGTA